LRTSGLLNGRLAGLIAEMGHTDMLVVADAGLPIPPGVERIDLALVPSVPAFVQTLQPILAELVVESAIIAEETGQYSPHLAAELHRVLQDRPISVVTHDELKRLSASARAVVRTGECTPYANVVLIAGVSF
jgi:D-ribose pyranase